MDPALLGLISQGVGNLLQIPLGVGQIVAGSLMKVKRPKYKIPEEVRNMLALRQLNLRGRMAGAGQAERNIMQGQANAIGTYQSTLNNPNAILAGVAASQGQTNRAMNDLNTQEAIDYQRRLAGMEGAQRTMTQFKDKAFELNEMQPYQDKARTKAALIGSGLKNFFGAISGGGEAVQDYAGYKMMQQQMGMGDVSQSSQAPPQASAPEVAPQAPGFSDFIPAGNDLLQSWGSGMAQSPVGNSAGLDALSMNMQFNNFAAQLFGTSVTNLTPMQLAVARQQYQSRG